jgi:hypothetical protein
MKVRKITSEQKDEYHVVAVLRRADHTPKKSYRLCKKDYEKEEKARIQQRDEKPLMDE